MTSAADIIVPTRRASRAAVLTSGSSAADVDAVFNGIDELLASCSSASYEDRLAVMIVALIERGINSRPRIVGAAKRKGFNAERAGRALTAGTGELWRRGEGGVYTVV